MAGAGYKLFNTGDVLLASEVNTYLMQQTVMVFADSAARTTALSGVLAEGMISYLADTNATEVYNGSAWVSVSGTGDITGVTAGTGLSGGGTTGAVTLTNDMATTITASGDIVVGTGSGTYDNLPIGTTGQVLTADTTVSPYKVKWAAAASSSPSYTLLNAGGTALTGAATITVSGISGKNEIFVYIDSASSNNSGAYIKVRINGSTTSGDYYYLSAYKAGTNDWYGISEYSGDAGALRLPTSTDAGTGSLFVHIYGCNGAGVKPFNGLSWGSENGDTNHEDYHWMGHYTPSTVVTSIAVTSSTGNFDAGTLYVYGA